MDNQDFYVTLAVNFICLDIEFCFIKIQITVFEKQNFTMGLGYAAERDCLKFKKKSWYPDIMSEDDIHWVPSANDPYNCVGHQSLYEVRRIFACCVFQETLISMQKMR